MNAFEEIQRYCLAKEGAVEEYPWGETVWKIRGKVFGIFGERLTVKASLEEQDALVQFPYIDKAAYVGRFGWVTITIDSEETLAHAKELLDRSYVSCLPKRAKRG